MNRKTVFVDVDGTLLDVHHHVADSAVRAIRTARANGHYVFLSTGRSKGQLWPGILDIGFDGIVASAGAYVEVGGKMLTCRSFAPETLVHMREFFDSHDTGYYFEGIEHVFAASNVGELLRQQRLESSVGDAYPMRDNGPFGFLNRMGDLDDVNEPILKVMYLGSSNSLAEVQREFAGEASIVPASTHILGTSSGEMMIAGVSKAVGLREAIEYLGVDISDTIALGDSFNDLEMLEAANVGVAMGNAPQAVVDVADQVTTPPEEDGVRLAFQKLGLVAR